VVLHQILPSRSPQAHVTQISAAAKVIGQYIVPNYVAREPNTFFIISRTKCGARVSAAFRKSLGLVDFLFFPRTTCCLPCVLWGVSPETDHPLLCRLCLH
jgi:hypothetical protein